MNHRLLVQAEILPKIHLPQSCCKSEFVAVDAVSEAVFHGDFIGVCFAIEVLMHWQREYLQDSILVDIL